jgi:hypothetical protein
MENGIITHAYEDPFKDKSIKLITLENNNIIREEIKTFQSKEEFQTLLGEVKQFNNDSTNQRDKRIQRIINI